MNCVNTIRVSDLCFNEWFGLAFVAIGIFFLGFTFAKTKYDIPLGADE